MKPNEITSKDSHIELILRLKAGDVNTFRSIYNDHWATVYYQVFRVLKHEEDTKDVVQEVLNAYNSGNYKLISENLSTSSVTIEVKGITGQYVNVGNPNGLPDLNLSTNKFMIQSTSSPKVVPVNPKK